MNLDRRMFLYGIASAGFANPILRASLSLTSRERVDRALQGKDVDRTPFTFWHHFGLEKLPPARHVQATLEFHQKFRTDLVKVMSDFPYPKPAGQWFEVKKQSNPFPAQVQALRQINQGLDKQAYFVETIFNSWNVAEKLSSPKEVLRLKEQEPQRLLDALEIITWSQIQHARLAISAGAAGIFLAIANAQDGILSREDYTKFSEPFDRRILEWVRSAPLNILHLHGDKVYLDRFYHDWAASSINYSTHGTGVPIAKVRQNYRGVLLAGLDETRFRSLPPEELRMEYEKARDAAGKFFILTPGCSVPNDSADAELLRVPQLLQAM